MNSPAMPEGATHAWGAEDVLADTSHPDSSAPPAGAGTGAAAARAAPPAAPRRRGRRRAAIGFVPRSETLHSLYNEALAGLLLLLLLPAIGTIVLLLLCTQGRPVFYRGTRVGRHGEMFEIYKFRTLDSERAAALTRTRVLPDGSGLETPLGGFLRETRLDELPQLFNILKGDMNLSGPRPVRPEIAQILSAGRPGPDARFAVKPGLLGPTQAFMSHGTPKPVRARLNAATCRRPVNYWGEVRVAALVGACVVARSLSTAFAKLRARAGKPGAGAARDLAARAGVTAAYRDSAGTLHPVARAGRRRFETAAGCAAGPGELVITLPGGAKRTARVHCAPDPAAAEGGGTVLHYRPRSAYAHYILDRYLRQCVVVPHSSHFLFSRLWRSLRPARGGGPEDPAGRPLPPVADEA